MKHGRWIVECAQQRLILYYRNCVFVMVIASSSPTTGIHIDLYIWWLLIKLAFSKELLLLPWLAMLYCCKMYLCMDVYVHAHTIDSIHWLLCQKLACRK